tara:strand:- start:636 stop:1565 length:930 start_codon:yes stop_codon:yes gene_type:complete
MNIRLSVFFILALSIFSLSAENAVYGKLWITAEYQNGSEKSESELVSNQSRIGFKGHWEFTNELIALYQLEYEVDPVDGTADENRGRTLKQRNSFVGLKSSYGTLFLGKHDTALKKSQAKIDLFNDLAGDITNVFQGENRMKDFVGFTTKTSEKGFSATLNAIKGSGELEKNKIGDYLSYSLNYKRNNFYAAIAIDSEAKGYDSVRYSIQIPKDKYQFGLIYQESQEISTNKTEDGFAVSGLRKIGPKGELKIQIAESDMKLSGGRQLTLGYDHKLNKQFEIFFFHTDLSTSNKLTEKTISAIGFEFKF